MTRLGCLGDELKDGWWRDRETLRREVEAHGGQALAGSAHGVAASTLSKWWAKHGLPKMTPGPQVQGTPADDSLELDVDNLGDISVLLRDRGLDPADWLVVRAVVNTWEGFLKDNDGEPVTVPLKALKVFLVRRVSSLLLSPAAVTSLPTVRSIRKPERAAKLYFVYGDEQRPNIDRTFEQLQLEWIRANQPDGIIDLGDGMDCPTLSGHKVNPAMHWSLQTCLDDYATGLYAKRQAAPNAQIIVLADNHFTQRLRDYQLERAGALYGVKPAEVAGLDSEIEPLLSSRRMLRLDEIGVDFIEPPAGTHYAESYFEIIPGELVAIHGYRTGGNLGKKFLNDYGCSVIYGHAHGQDVEVTDEKRRGIGQRKRRYALGVGCTASIHGGGGFAPGADWQNSALTVSVFPDGRWTWDPVNYEDGVLLWRDQRYSMELQQAA